MKINNKIINIPPYISTTWNYIRCLSIHKNHLIINLTDDTVVEIPNLKSTDIEMIFAAHANFIENQSASATDHPSPPRVLRTQPSQPFSFANAPNENNAFSFGFATFDSLDALGSALQHNQDHFNNPELPKDILFKISTIAKIVTPEEGLSLPKPESDCNCNFCQIARALQNGLHNEVLSTAQAPLSIEEEVEDIDLNFQEWDVKEMGEKIFSVCHRLDATERYSVYLGHPVGCTCGKEGCEHILAVLKS